MALGKGGFGLCPHRIAAIQQRKNARLDVSVPVPCTSRAVSFIAPTGSREGQGWEADEGLAKMG